MMYPLIGNIWLNKFLKTRGKKGEPLNWEDNDENKENKRNKGQKGSP